MKNLIAVLLMGSVAPSAFDGHITKIMDAGFVQFTLTTQQVGGAAAESTVKLSKPNLFSIDSGKVLVQCDGETIWTLNKAANTYTKQRASGENVMRVMNQPALWAYSPLFMNNTEKWISSQVPGKVRTLKGVKLDEVLVLPSARPLQFSIWVSQESGVVVGCNYKMEGNDVIVTMNDVVIKKAPAEASKFAMKLPEGASEAKEPEAPKMPTWKDVQPIFAQHCMPCHGAEMKAGIDLRSYQSVMSTAGITPGEIEGNRVLRAVKSSGRGQMPPPGRGQRLNAAQVGTLENWIKEGAKEN